MSGTLVLDPHELRANVDFPTIAGFVSTHLPQYMNLIKDVQNGTTAAKAKDWQNWGAAVKDGVDQSVTLLQDWGALNLNPTTVPTAHFQMQLHALEQKIAAEPNKFGDGTLLKGIITQLGTFINSPLGQTLEQALLNLLLGSLTGGTTTTTPPTTALPAAGT